MVDYTRRKALQLFGLAAGAAALNASGLELALGCGSANSQGAGADPVASAPRMLENDDPAYSSARRPRHFAGPYVIEGDAVAEMRNLAGLLMYNDGKSPDGQEPSIEQGSEGPYLGVHFSEKTIQETEYLIRACQLADKGSDDFVVTKAEARAALEPVAAPIYEELRSQQR